MVEVIEKDFYVNPMGCASRELEEAIENTEREKFGNQINLDLK